MGKCYLITGSSGYLGNQLVKVLCQHNIDEVTGLKLVDINISGDVKEQQEKWCNEAGITAQWIEADITDKESVQKAVKDVDVVIHNAAIVDIFEYIPEKVMSDVLLQGTINMLESCCSANVQHLIYTSTSEVVGPNANGDPFVMGNEDTPYHSKPGSFYSKYKHEAEQHVLAANGRQMKNGKKLVTCALRPNFVYGGDNRVMEEALAAARGNKTLISLSARTVLNKSIFVDNVAWSHVLAAKKMQTSASLIGGNAYFLGDDTPPMSYFRLMLVVFEPFGYIISREPILPVWMLYIVGFVLAMLSKFLALFNIHKKPFLTPKVVTYLSTTFTFTHKKFEKHFDYKPLISYEESIEITRKDLENVIKKYS